MQLCKAKDETHPNGCMYVARSDADLANHRGTSHPGIVTVTDNDDNDDSTKAGTCQWHDAQGRVCGHQGSNKEVSSHRKLQGHPLALVYADLGGRDMDPILAAFDHAAIDAGHVTKRGTPRRGTYAREVIAAHLGMANDLAAILAQRDAAARHGGGNGVVTTLRTDLAAAQQRANVAENERAALMARLLEMESKLASLASKP